MCIYTFWKMAWKEKVEEAWSDDNFFLLKKIVTGVWGEGAHTKKSEVKAGGGREGDVLK